MRKEPIQIDPAVKYPDQWVPVEFVCRCGVKCRVDIEARPGFGVGGDFYQHCSKDEGRYVPGTIIASWEERDGSLVLVSVQPRYLSLAR